MWPSRSTQRVKSAARSVQPTRAGRKKPENNGRRLRLFGQVYDADQEELLGALNYLRCTGAQIIDGDVGWRIDRGVAVMAHVDRRTMHMLQMRPCAALVCSRGVGKGWPLLHQISTREWSRCP
jgi:hypothetical protein